MVIAIVMTMFAAMSIASNVKKGLVNYHPRRVDREPIRAVKWTTLGYPRTRCFLRPEPVFYSVVEPAMKVPEERVDM